MTKSVQVTFEDRMAEEVLANKLNSAFYKNRMEDYLLYIRFIHWFRRNHYHHFKKYFDEFYILEKKKKESNIT